LKTTRGCASVLLALLLGLLPGLLRAQQCSRVLQVPVAPIGLAVTVHEGKVGGIYPDLLRSWAAKSGCTVAFSVVPRARQEMMYETGQADLLLPARRSAHRDEYGQFVPMIKSRAVLVSLQSERPAVHSLAELQQRHDLRVVVVRGYDYGQAYQSLLKELDEQGRLLQATDPISLARMLDGGIADLAILTPTILTGALRKEAKLRPLIARLRYQPVAELPWGESGVYLASKSSLGAADRQLLLELLERMGKSGAAWREFQRHYPDEQLTETVRPR
jgi:polar amino acid transport system substrate-binding protein